MLNHISIDVTDAKECAVPKDKFRINNYTFTPGAATEDLVHNSAPYIHLQILRPNDDEQRDKAIAYFKKHQNSTSPLRTARRFCFTWAQPKRFISRVVWILWR